MARRYGGPSTAIFPMVTALNRLLSVSAVIATTDADGPGSRIATKDLPTDVPMRLFHRNCSERWKVSWGLTNWLSSHVRDYDIVHIHAVWSFATTAAARAARRHGVPYIIRPAGMLSAYTWRRGNWIKRLYWNAIEHHNVESAAAIHVTSRAEADEIQAIQPHARTYIISNGVEDAAFTSPRDCGFIYRKCSAAAADKPILLFLSRLHPKKGIIDRLLPAVASMRAPCCLAIAGGPDPHAPEHENEVLATIKKLGLQNRVAMLGSVDGGDRWQLFDGAVAFVLPSHSENFGIVVAEAMARGCPVVVTDTVQSAEHVMLGQAGVVVTGEPNELAATLDKLVASPNESRVLGEAGAQYAAHNFRWNQIAQQIASMYRDCIISDAAVSPSLIGRG